MFIKLICCINSVKWINMVMIYERKQNISFIDERSMIK